MCDEAAIANFEVIEHLLQWTRGFNRQNQNNLFGMYGQEMANYT
jgi:hypothetical protein